MQITAEENRVYLAGEAGETRAEATFRTDGGALVIERTYVDPALRGQGVARELMRAVAAVAHCRGLRIEAACSYAAAYFARHGERAD